MNLLGKSGFVVFVEFVFGLVVVRRCVGIFRIVYGVVSLIEMVMGFFVRVFVEGDVGGCVCGVLGCVSCDMLFCWFIWFFLLVVLLISCCCVFCVIRL